MSRAIAIKAKGLFKSYVTDIAALFRRWFGSTAAMPSFDALKNIDLAVPAGEMLGVLGHNGAGKSTLLRLLGGVFPPDAGVIDISGAVAGMFELGGFGHRYLTGRDYARRYLRLQQLPPQDWPSVIAEIEEFAELGAYFDKPILFYSSGMAARLYFAVATAIPRQIYLIDEILSVGDEYFQTKSWLRIRERVSGGASGILVTHDWSAVIKLCREAKILQRGELIDQGDADRVVARYLALTPPDGSIAEIILPDVLRLETIATDELEIEIHIKQVAEVELAVSIERIALGKGWEIIQLLPYRPIASQPGRYRVRIQWPAVPLAAGDYVINFFCALAPDKVTGQREALHAVGWTYQNGKQLVVSGDARPDMTPFPVRWS